MLEFLKQIDTELFLFLNSPHSDFSDFVMWWISNKYIWIPLYLFVLILIIRKYKVKSLIVVFFLILMVVATDQLSVHLFKNIFQRYRPCHNAEIQHLVHTVDGYCGGKFGFISSHAANTFGFAVMSLLFIRNKWFSISILAWASIVSYSRIALGVHYPSDIFVGAMLGTLIAVGLYKLAEKVKGLSSS
ncbi:MAG TPA: phosphatase PAP2 family protein [Bacteroidales bacterium]|nr:MAG: hypothetical protein A2W98_06425 [Bacteroidetes bacterium GWF2_33_38]OFY70166.1 MAG: hypothetical protein A2265_01435 [Bacteroidetes bacterium RIFOXYA12_FULL_33_9]OFY89278.1 MAG: hypothetical protein A2236_09590 [Bacteroidetes bacterium RIFOXYA2_FULL_33_7]HBF87157.1 phosphatase PAP2 family protein [Bacteroidales bacterium]